MMRFVFSLLLLLSPLACGGGSGGGSGTGGGAARSGGATGTGGTVGIATGGAGPGDASVGSGGVTGAGTGGTGGIGGSVVTPSPDAGADVMSGGADSGGATDAGAGVPDASAGDGPSTLAPPPGQYGTRANLAAPNSEMAVGEAAGKIYVVGGYPSSRVIQATVQVYDPVANLWSLGPPYPFPIHHPVLATVGAKLYSLGGQIAMTGVVDTNRTFEFDPATAMWRELRPMPTARGAGAAAVIGTKIYVVGGRPPAANAFQVYDVSDDSWATLPPLPQQFPQRNHLAATAIAGKIYVAGGRYNGGSFQDPMTDSLDVFDPATNMWTAGARMLRARGGVNGIAANGCFHVWGGEGTNTGEPNDVFPDHDVYNPRSNSWTALPRLPTPVHGVTGAAFLNGIIYIPGGGTSSGGSSGSLIFQVFRPDPALRCD